MITVAARRLLLVALSVVLTVSLGRTAPAASNSPVSPSPAAGRYQNFNVAIYIPVGLVRRFTEPAVLEREWAVISRDLRVDKVYIETQRDRVLADEALLERVKAFFATHGVATAGGITFSDGGGGQFRSFCYTDPADRAFVRQAMELTARHFDEIILDDFFFVTTKYPSDIEAKGSRSWTQFRLELMNEAGRELVVRPAKAVNPRARVIIKYPNWYEHFAGLGFDLQEGPRIYDGVYTGTETRDPQTTDQFLQQYESYQIVRYLENIAPSRNGGGWVDTFNLEYVDRYAEQLWNTVFAKAREMTLFNWAALLQPAVAGQRAGWAGARTSFRWEELMAYRPKPDGTAAPAAVAGVTSAAPSMARVAGYSLDLVDAFLGRLGQPIGIASYRPPHATGDDFLHNYLGMIGLPIELYPTFPDQAPVVLLTEAARSDPDLVAKIKRHLLAGKSVIVTASLYRALHGRGIEEIVEIEPTDKRILSDGFSTGYGAGERVVHPNAATGAPPILFPQLRFLTNDAWALVSAMSDGAGFPLLLMDRYGKDGTFYVWNLPDNFRHLYRLPPAVTQAVKDVVMRGFPVRLDGPSEVALFAYDNHTFIVESYRAAETAVKLGTLGAGRRIRDLVSGEVITGTPPPTTRTPWGQQAREPRTTFDVTVPPHSFRVFQLEAVDRD
ncbi:hypothetical protein [Opitutus sp. ER46]|uniref:hypothetical protein n=1 Tax=Opitutus sp. ER46 TaxID=2161864 RepID=UPI000D31EE03|nr:hypothetical protein [Opitutus sp. ER46]PTX91561.1 hypothetical protein DB354_16935 [Opitutus sp. ER46]